MLSKALKGGFREYTAGPASRCIKLQPQQPSSAGCSPRSFGEELLFEYIPAAPQHVCVPPQSPFVEVTRQAQPEGDDTAAWMAEGLEDDEHVVAPQQPPSLCTAIATASGAAAHERIVLPPARSHHAPWHGSIMPTTSAPTISSTLAATSSLNRTALSAVSMAILAEDEEYMPSPGGTSTSRLISAAGSSMSRSRSVPMSIAPSEGTSLVTRLEHEIRAEERMAIAVPGSVPSRRYAKPGKAGQEEEEKVFQPPHEIAAASYCEAFANPSASLLRRQSIANRLKSVVFEQTGLMATSCGKGFLGPMIN